MLCLFSALRRRVAALQIIMSNSVASNCYGAQLHNGVNVMMSDPVASNCYGEQPHNGVSFMMSDHVTLKKNHNIRAKKKN